MDLAYSVTLIVALIAGVLALLREFLALRRRNAHGSTGQSSRDRPQGGRAIYGVLILGTLSLASSVVVHLLWGHGPAAPVPMDLGHLLREHEAFSVAAIVVALGFMLNAYAATRPRNRGDA